MPNGSCTAPGRDNVTQASPPPASNPHYSARRTFGQLRQVGFSWLSALGLVVALPVAGAMCGALVVALALLLANDRLPPLDALIVINFLNLQSHGPGEGERSNKSDPVTAVSATSTPIEFVDEYFTRFGRKRTELFGARF